MAHCTLRQGAEVQARCSDLYVSYSYTGKASAWHTFKSSSKHEYAVRAHTNYVTWTHSCSVRMSKPSGRRTAQSTRPENADQFKPVRDASQCYFTASSAHFYAIQYYGVQLTCNWRRWLREIRSFGRDSKPCFSRVAIRIAAGRHVRDKTTWPHARLLYAHNDYIFLQRVVARRA